MSQSASRFALYCSLFTVSLFIGACSLASDVTPPPGYEQVAAAPPTQASIDFPASAPSTTAGASLYAQNCTRCHGIGGAGDGEFASQIAFPIPAFTNPDLAFTTTPQRWFGIITHGNLDRMMPPWESALSDVERWHLVAHLYGISSNAAAGQPVYKANCASCHGLGGLGDGADATGALPDFTDQQFMTAKSNQQFFESLSTPEHDFTETLEEAELKAAVDYVRTFSFKSAPSETVQGLVGGTLTNGTDAAAVIPDGQEVELHLFDNFSEVDVLTTTAANGSFEFTGVDLPAGRALIATTRYNDVLYTSDVVQVTGEEGGFELPILVYDSSTDDSAISLGRMHIVFEFNSSDAVQVGELLLVNNSGSTTLRPETENGPTLGFALPSGYTSLTFQDGAIGEGYLQTDNGFADTLPIGPGVSTRQILVSFKLPYTDALTFTQTLPYTTSEINILLPDVGVTLAGTNLVDAGVQQMDGGNFRLYTIAGTNAGDTISFTLSGKPGAASTGTTSTGTTAGTTSTPPVTFDWRSTLIGVLAFGLALSLAAFWWISQKPQPAPAEDVLPVRKGTKRAASGNAATPARRNELLDSIAALDDAFEAGGYDENKYRKERERLKAELVKVMGEKK